MTARLIDGRKVASDLKENLKKEVFELKSKGIDPCLAVIFDETDSPSRRYVNLKKEACADVGIGILIHSTQKITAQDALIELIEKLNADSEVNGILLQFPFPKELNKRDIINSIAPEKDIDGCGPYAIGKLTLGEPYFVPAAPGGVIRMLDAYGIEIIGKEVIIVGSNTIAKSLALLFLKKNAIVTICPAETPDLKAECLRAEILCAVVEKANTITADMIKDGAVVIDMGMNITADGKIIGDVDFDSVKEKASYITPVPGGTGPVTIAMLLYNTVLAAKMQSKIL